MRRWLGDEDGEMQRKEALAYVGKRVSAWTSANGVYVGVLERVTDGRPWRGVVRIDGVVKPAVCYEAGRGFRRGFRVGQEIEVGGASIEPTEAFGEQDYFGLLRASAEGFEAEYAAFMAGAYGDPNDLHVAKNYAWMQRGAADVRAAIARIEDEERLEVEGARAVSDAEGWVQMQISGGSDAVDAAFRKLPRGVTWCWSREPRGWRLRPDGDAVERLEALLAESGDGHAAALAGRLAEWRESLSAAPRP